VVPDFTDQDANSGWLVIYQFGHFVIKPALETTSTALISVGNFSSIQVAMAATEERKCWLEMIPGR
jgi:hypothetical protein